MFALPALEAMLPAARATAASGPRRLVFLYLPNGMHMPHWTPKADGAGYDFPPTLAPQRAHVSVLTGLTHAQARALGDGSGSHARANATFLTGSHPKKTGGGDVRAGVSVDQIAAQRVGRTTRLASLEMSCDTGRTAGTCDSGYSCIYQNNLAWRNETTPLPPLTNPRSVFERLYGGDGAGRPLRPATRRSILDLTMEDARTLQKDLGANDRRKLDEYFTAVRETELQIEQAEKFAGSLPKPSIAKPDGIPEQYTEHFRLMYRLLGLALQTDSTRIATFMVAHEGSNRPYPFLGVSDGHHELSHHGGSAEKQAKIAKINRFHMEMLAEFLGELATCREGAGSVLDHSMIVCGSAISDGDRHNNEDLPVLLCGGGAGALKPGRHIRYADETPMCNLYVSLLGRLGAPVEKFGDSNGRLEDV